MLTLSQLVLSSVVAGVNSAPVPPVFINTVSSEVGQGGVTIEIAGEQPLDASSMRADVSSDGRVVLRLPGTRVHGGNRAWGEGTAKIRAHRHKSHTELEVPVPVGGGCVGPASVAGTPDGVVLVKVSCPSLKARSEQTQVVKQAEVTEATPSLIASVVAPPKDRAALVAALALDAEKARADEPKTQETVKPAAVETAPVIVPKVPVPAPMTAIATAIPAAAPSSWRMVVVPLGALLFLGGAAIFLGRRRKITARLVNILETVSLGPKRSLIVACVGGETLILGSSEAGITLLRSGDRASAAVHGASKDSRAIFATSGGVERTASDDSGDADAPGQVRFLARLFNRKPKEDLLSDVTGAEPWNFDDILGDSLEDQELRRKLSAGVGARVP